jgi:hypothetical protein
MAPSVSKASIRLEGGASPKLLYTDSSAVLISACVVLIMVETTPALQGKLDEGRLAELWRQSHEILEFFTTRRATARRYAAGLRALRQRAMHVYQRDLAGHGSASNASASTSENQVPHHPTVSAAAQESDTSCRLVNENRWHLEAPFHDPLLNFDDQDWPDFEASEAEPDVASMVQGLQNSFGGAFLPCSVWYGMDQATTATMTSLSGI